MEQKQPNSAADAPAAEAARCTAAVVILLPVSASVWYARRSGMQGVAGRMLLEEKKNVVLFLFSPNHNVLKINKVWQYEINIVIWQNIRQAKNINWL